MTIIREKFNEVIAAVIPVSLFVIVLQILFNPLNFLQLIRFFLATGLIILGLTIFLLGIELSITRIGESFSKTLVKSKKLWIILPAAFLLGFLINVAEPDIIILAKNIAEITRDAIPALLLLLVVSAGVGFMVMIGFFRHIHNIKLSWIFTFAYGSIGILAMLGPTAYHAFAFDACGATTGAITTPFLLALASGLSVLSKQQTEDDAEGFGMVGLASSGAVIAVLFLGAIAPAKELQGGVGITIADQESILAPFIENLLPLLKQSIMAIAPLFILYLLLNMFNLKSRAHQFRLIVFGIIYCVLGLTCFMVGVNGSFMLTGQIMGQAVGSRGMSWLPVVIGFFLGMTTVLAEPAVHVLTDQIEEQSAGTISKKLVLVFLSFGVACAVALAMLRILVPSLQLWHILLPLYIAALYMSHKVGELYTGIAFDSGGVVSGPMTATFALAFAQGIASVTPGSDVVLDGYGLISLVATSPMITLQILGLIDQAKRKKEASKSA